MPTQPAAYAEDKLKVVGVEGIYEDMMDVLTEVSIFDVNEHFYMQDVDDHTYKAKFTATKKLDNMTKLKLDFTIYTEDTPKDTEHGLYGTIIIKIEAMLDYDEPEPSQWLGIFNTFFHDIWWHLSYKHQLAYHEEYSMDRLKKVIKKIRDYYGLPEPAGKVKKLHFKPI